MDQAKFKMPRLDPRERRSKLVDRLYRPQMHVVCSWVHGWGLCFWVSGEDLKKDSTTSTECTARTLSDMYNDVGCLPLRLEVQHDGTYREAKNRFYLSFLLMLTALQVFRTTSVSFLRPGHSHSEVESVWTVLDENQ